MTHSQNNKELYESANVLHKYGANNVRSRTLNNAEKDLIDRFDIKNKKVLVVGCGAGRVPANLLLFGNTVVGVDRSAGMIALAQKNFSHEKFPLLTFIHGDATDLSFLEDESFDAVLMPQNAIDYIESVADRVRALAELSKKVQKEGLLAFSSHNIRAYACSCKVPFFRHSARAFFDAFVYAREHVVGGGYIFKGKPAHVIEQARSATGMEFCGYTCDTRGKIDRLFAKSLVAAQWVFPHITYVFRKGRV